MTTPITRPKRKNPVLRTRLPTLPPWGRSRIALGITAAAAAGRFELQQCADCGAVQYPPREACHACLSARLQWKAQSGAGRLLSETVLHHSNDLFFRERLPWRLGLGATRQRPDADGAPARWRAGGAARVKVDVRLDRAGQAVLLGFPETETEHMSEDRVLREMTCDPKFRKVLVTDGKTAVGQAIVKALVTAGADIVWVGHAEPWKKLPGLDGNHRAAAGHAGAARPDQRKVGERTCRRSGRQSRHRHQQRRSASQLRHRHAPRRRRRARRNGHQLLRPAAPRAGVRAGAQGARRRRSRQCGGVGQPAVDLRAVELSAARHLLRPPRPPRCRSRSACAPKCGRRASASSTCFPGRSTTSGTS